MHFIGFIDKNRLSKLYTLKYYKNCLNDLIWNWINVLYFFYDDKEIDINKQTRKKLDDIWIKILWYKDYKDIINYLKKIKWLLFINTFQENQILMTSKLKSDLWQKVTENYELFLNKFLQRDILGSKYPETITGYKIVKKSKNLENIKLKYPIIVKPVWWIQSSWTFKVSNNLELKNAVNNIYNNVLPKLRNKWLLESDIILEEYIDGDMYTIDYFVDEDQNITRPSPVKILLWTDYGINDFSNIVRILSNQVQNKINNNKLS